MASLKPVLSNFIKADGKCNIKIRISHHASGDPKGKTRYISTPWSIELRFMNIDGTINSKYPGQSKLNLAINLLLAEYNGILEGIGKDIRYMDINTLTKKLRQNEPEGTDFTKYTKSRIRILKEEKRFAQAESYETTIMHLKVFALKDDILFKEINLDFLQRFERHLSGKKVNTIRAYMNNIRAIFNHAIDNDVIKIELFPFRKFKIKEEKTRKRNLDIAEIRKLLSIDLNIFQQRAMDLFMLSFYLLGMNFKDMLYLTPADVNRGRIEYGRAKTGKNFSIKIYPPAMRIIEKYKGKKYLLKFLEQSNPKRDKAYKDVITETNKQLKKIAEIAELDIPLSTYYARHSWATIAYKLGITKDVISEALGHSTGSQMTEIYMERDNTYVDEANRKVIQSIMQ